MKEAYFTEDTIKDLSSAWQQEYSRPGKAAEQPFQMDRAGLLILDMQEYFLDQDSHAYVPSARPILAGLNRLAARFREASRPVIATQHINTPADAGMMSSWWSELITRDHARAGITAELDILPDEILQKSQYDAFYESSLGQILEDSRVEQLVIGGVLTHLCCETTARSAFVRGYEVFFLVDGTATYHRDFHTATLRNLAHGVAVLISGNHLLGEV